MPPTIAAVTSFLVETFVPQGDPAQFTSDIDVLRAAVARDYEGRVHHVRSYLVPGDEMGVHVIDADSAELIRQLATDAGLRLERVVAAVGIESPGVPKPAIRGTTDTTGGMNR